MTIRITHIILFMALFLLQSFAQDSYIEYNYVDGTKEKDTTISDRMEYNYIRTDGLSYTITSINISDVFDPLSKNDRYSAWMRIGFNNGDPSFVSGPTSTTSMGNSIVYQYDVFLDQIDVKNGVMAVVFNSKDTNPKTSRHSNKQINSISGRIIYSKFKTIPSQVLSDELVESLKPFYLDSRWVGSNIVNSQVNFISPSYDQSSKKANYNDLSIERVSVIKNLKKMGYVLTSQKGVYPLIYKKDNASTVKMYETYIEVEVPND